MVTELPNYVLGEKTTSDKNKIIHDIYGKDSLKIFDVTQSQLRKIKRRFPELQSRLSKIEISEVIETIKKAMKHYYSNKEKLKLCSLVTGSPLWFMEAAIIELNDWVSNIEEYLRLSLGHHNYEHIPIMYEGKEIAYQHFSSNNPLIAILPRNSELESAYVIIQALLSRTPCIVKGPSQQGSILTSLEFMNALEQVVNDKTKILLESVNIVNILEDDKSMILERLAYDNATYIIFGSNTTINQAEEQLKHHNPKKIVKLGTGFSVSVVFDDANIEMAATEICDSASVDRGNDCISTNVVYADEKIKHKLIEKINLVAKNYESGDPLENTKIGKIHQDDIKTINERTSHLPIKCTGYPENVHLSIFELEDNHHFEEYPGPVMGIRSFNSHDELIQKFLTDLEHNGVKRNLVTAVFTDDKRNLRNVVARFSSHTFKHNKGSHKMNFLLEHQGLYLIKELLERRIVEVE